MLEFRRYLPSAAADTSIAVCGGSCCRPVGGFGVFGEFAIEPSHIESTIPGGGRLLRIYFMDSGSGGLKQTHQTSQTHHASTSLDLHLDKVENFSSAGFLLA